jgi:hypothetical protein
MTQIIERSGDMGQGNKHVHNKKLADIYYYSTTYGNNSNTLDV